MRASREPRALRRPVRPSVLPPVSPCPPHQRASKLQGQRKALEGAPAILRDVLTVIFDSERFVSWLQYPDYFCGRGTMRLAFIKSWVRGRDAALRGWLPGGEEAGSCG
jgi:hypothetical protein